MARRASLAAILISAPLVGLLAWLSVSSTIAFVTALPAGADASSALPSPAVSPERAQAAAAANAQAARWFDNSRYNLRAARTVLLLPGPNRRRERAQVEALVRASLSAAPMSPYGWTLLAFLRLERGDQRGAARAWEMSVLVGRYVPNVMQARLLLGMRILRTNPDMAASVTDQVRVLAQGDPSSLAAAARHGGIEAPVRAILAGSEEAADFERATRAMVAAAGSRLKQRAEAQP
ncbi:hypothetical protein [Sphingomonas sp.]|uniref:hypothetical protein n=1 Tax=Sphingomonas sp. TaxID=28214 RepID=UPI003B3A09AE